ncbi:glycerophosphodiester phosphodiesterase [Actinoplanes sp. NPDC023936]|uniref:glycerophosphodiester phosphodiesterase n=1 Tax=Actinoplanes sp. NPDC023936 TaxID=3154910 RepID=UPI0033D81841
MLRRTAASAAFFVALALLPATPGVAAAATCPIVASHAAKVDAPENTVPGIRNAAAAGAGLVELDVRWSKGDGTAAYPGWPVLMHDPTVDRTTNGTGQVSALGLGDLGKLSAAAYAPWSADARYAGFLADGKPRAGVPYAYDFLTAARAASVRPLLDVKVTPNRVQMDKLVEYLDKTSTRDSVIYMSSPAAIATVRPWYPDLEYWAIEYPANGSLRSGAYLRSLGVTTYAVQAQAADLDAAAVAYWHSTGLKVATWSSDSTTIDSPSTWQQVRTEGVDYLITNRPADAIAALNCGS